jgi:hypothetical protein
MQYTRRNTQTENIDSQHFQDTLKTTSNADEQQKVKIAFAEGLIFVHLKICFYVRDLCLGYIAAAGEPKPKERPSLFKTIRVILFYSILILLILNIISALGVGMYVS